MNRHYNSGKAKLSSIFIVLALIYGGYALVKYISANIMQGQIRVEITDSFGLVRGPSFTVEEGVKIIKGILETHGVLDKDYDEDDYEDDSAVEHDDTETSADREVRHQRINVEINTKTTMVHFYVTYEYENDFLFFKHKKVYEVRGEVQNYN